MTRIYLIRHAEAEGNLYRIAQGQDNSSLTDRGWRQVRALEQRFTGVPIDQVYSSDLYRACATAGAICKPRGMQLHRVPELREICVGVWEQKTWGEIYRRWPEQMHWFSHQPHLWQVEGAETPGQVLERVLKALRKIAAENDGKTVAVFSHGYAIRLVLARLQGYTLEQTGGTPTGDNTAVSLLEADGGELRVLFRDDNSHLKTEAFLAQEKVMKRANGLEPGLWFQALELPGQEDFFVKLVEDGWQGRTPFDRKRLLADARERTTLVGYRQEEPVGVIQLGPERGWISLICMREDCRKRGLGTQILGQAVQKTRFRGGESLWVSLPENSDARSFFDGHRFEVVEEADGSVVLEKKIHFDAEFL